MFSLLQKLCLVPAPSGREHKLAQTILPLAAQYADECRIDCVGNVIARIDGTGKDRKRLLFSAHMDEVGGIVTKIEPNGAIRFATNGNLRLMSAVYHDVMFESGTRGVMAMLEGASVPDEKTCFIDIGASNRAEAARLTEIGEMFTVRPGVFRMAGDMIAGHPIDDRVGCAILLETARSLRQDGKRPFYDVYLVFSVQEEIALPPVGATVAANAIRPDIAIAVDVCSTGDVPGAQTIDVYAGGGAAIHVRDTSIVADRDLVNEMKAAAREENIPYQLLVSYAGGNDAAAMQKAGCGSKAGLISVPMRYLHTSAETLSLADAQACVSLASALCRRLTV